MQTVRVYFKWKTQNTLPHGQVPLFVKDKESSIAVPVFKG